MWVNGQPENLMELDRSIIRLEMFTRVKSLISSQMERDKKFGWMDLIMLDCLRMELWRDMEELGDLIGLFIKGCGKRIIPMEKGLNKYFIIDGNMAKQNLISW